jgi:flotillin
MRIAELDATQIAQANADASRVRIAAEASADAEAIRIRRVADATAESIQKVNEAIKSGGESYFRYRQIEMLPQIAPAIADALAQARLVTISNGDTGAPETTTNNITSVIQTVLAAQLVSRGLVDVSPVATVAPPTPTAAEARLPSSVPTRETVKK